MLKENEIKDKIKTEKERAVVLKDLIEFHEFMESLDQVRRLNVLYVVSATENCFEIEFLLLTFRTQ